MSSPPATLIVVGAGPRAVGLLERMAANARPDSVRELTIHVVDPFPPGAGRTWRRDQSPLLWMNSRACDVTMFTDHTVRCAGPIRTGPTLAEWAAGPAARWVTGADLVDEAATLRPESFPSRRLGGEYLSWCFWRAVKDLPPYITVHVHATTAVRLSDAGRQQVVRLATGERLVGDLVVLAQGAIDGGHTPDRAHYADVARRHGGVYVPPAYHGQAEAAALPAGRDVIVSGIGLAFFDLMALVTEGRGGRYRRVGGELEYCPSGAEPILWVGSRRGLPYRPKAASRLVGPECELPRFATARAIRSVLRAGVGEPDHQVLATLWGLWCKELAWGYYHELAHAHPDRTVLPWPRFAAEFAPRGWWDTGMVELINAAVPDPADRMVLDLDDFSLSGHRFASEPELAAWMRAHLGTLVWRATDPDHSAETGAARALLHAALQLVDLRVHGDLPDNAGVLAWLSRLTSFLGSGPPPIRLAQLCALSRAGVVRFLGARLTVTEGPGGFTATSSLGQPVSTPYFVEARLPDTDLVGGDRLLAALVRDAAAVPVGPPGAARLLVDATSYAVCRPDGATDSHRLALGAFASGGALGSFSRPGTDAPFFRQNDDVARWLLARLLG